MIYVFDISKIMLKMVTVSLLTVNCSSRPLITQSYFLIA